MSQYLMQKWLRQHKSSLYRTNCLQ